LPRQQTEARAERSIAPPRSRGMNDEPSPRQKPEPVAAESVKEPKSERSSLASFFGFGSRSSEPAVPAEVPRESGPAKKGWWQKR
jgi:hypothetical protein